MNVTKYCNQLTVITPTGDWPGANALAACFGEGGTADLTTFRSVTHTREGVDFCEVKNIGVTDTIKGALQAQQVGILNLQGPDFLTAEQLAAAGATLNSALILLDFDPENPPAYSGQTIIALNVDANSILSAYGFEAVHDD